jgi:hypothetical protein
MTNDELKTQYAWPYPSPEQTQLTHRIDMEAQDLTQFIVTAHASLATLPPPSRRMAGAGSQGGLMSEARARFWRFACLINELAPHGLDKETALRHVRYAAHAIVTMIAAGPQPPEGFSLPSLALSEILKAVWMAEGAIMLGRPLGSVPERDPDFRVP